MASAGSGLACARHASPAELRMVSRADGSSCGPSSSCARRVWACRIRRRASGSDDAKRPTDWLASAQGKGFAEFIAESQGAGIDGILRREAGNPRAGEGGVTWAHWQLGMAYAKDLSPEFHAWCNDVVRKVTQGAPVARTEQTSSRTMSVVVA